MHLVAPLIAGIRGAENGSVKFTRRGTAAPSRIYRSFEGVDPDDSGDAVLLDSNGGVEIYVDTLTTVSVKDSGGNKLREFVAGDAAPAVEVRSSAFTGQEYDDGSGIKPAGPSQPTTLQGVLDLWATVNGATDWKVGDGSGDEFTLPDLVSALIHSSVDVTAPQYGAKGDLINDDLSAFVLADADATSRGGATILVPPNLGYALSGTFTLGPLNSIFAQGDTVIQSNSVTGTVIEVLGGAPGKFIRGVQFKTAGASTSIQLEVAGEVIVERCSFGDGADIAGSLIQASTGAKVLFNDCKFSLSGATAEVFTQSTITELSEVIFNRCTFITPPGSYTGVMFRIYFAVFSFCEFIAPSGVSNGGNAFTVIRPEDDGELRLVGCKVRFGTVVGETGDPEGLGTFIAIEEQVEGVWESANDYKIFRRIVNPGLGSIHIDDGSFDSLRKEVSNGPSGAATDAVVAISAYEARSVFITRTVSSNFTFDLHDSSGLAGQDLIVTIVNASGGNISTVTPGAFATALTSQINNGEEVSWYFISLGGGGGFRQVGETVRI
jgi:hypothetical protein